MTWVSKTKGGRIALGVTKDRRKGVVQVQGVHDPDELQKMIDALVKLRRMILEG